MKYGISLLPDCRPHLRSAAQYYADVLRASRLADQLGFEYVKMTEHYLKDYGGYCPSPLAFLTAVAAQTSRIRLMTGGIQASFHHPIQLAADTSQLDAVSGGRLDVGFARAWLPYEFEAFGIDLDESRARFTETIEAVVRLWTEDKTSEDTPFFRYTDATSLPPVTQTPHPPVWVAAVRSRESFAWIGEKGFSLLIASPPREEELPRMREMVEVYRETFEEEHGASGRKPRVALSVPLHVAETDDEAYTAGAPFLREYLQVWGEAADSWAGVTSSAYPGYSAAGKTFLNTSEADLRSTATGVLGSPGTVVEKIHALRDALSLDTMLWQIDFGGQNAESMERNLRLFAQEVWPKVR
ncbi:alkanesulfonate monooxygenase SsuD/methylene tetrahydromethanopterin reductase-like flavin-dependent oxidoreductase (luciferase family) [Streptomyces sp. 1114.5]|uniref:LLM class flavin-dependent oxidoreductase n=1 Tax=Streptomyces sp. 1114.5 TaxID=1938830 RepID=UPI000EB0B429|nr:LLM class flavin-dependent oxidoreductase [Streptomyces sp. 1114.5]RKT11329.1 alkanesulfonate monooxygenase SsuD/methylene tetrahydromethanopterin reductase-like flavin-dependent oxidoreductase (luciferase family) [Streptomyces sp. 1114.5]